MTDAAGPLVSVVIPAYNAAPYVLQAASSVAAQQYRPLQLVVVDDASTDGTAAIVEALASRLQQAGVDLLLLRHERNLGAAQALSLGFDRSDGEFIAWLSADDAFVAPWKTSAQVSFMQRTGCGVSFFRTTLEGPDSDNCKPSTGSWLSPRLRWLDPYVEGHPARTMVALWFGNPINGSSSMIRRDVYERSGGFDPILRNVDADADLWMRCLAQNASVKGITGAPVFYRIHPSQTSQSDPTMAVGTQATRVKMIRGLEQRQLLREVLKEAWIILWLRTFGRTVVAWPSTAREIIRQVQAHGPGSSWVARVVRRMTHKLDAVSSEFTQREDEVSARAAETASSRTWQSFLSSL